MDTRDPVYLVIFFPALLMNSSSTDRKGCA